MKNISQMERIILSAFIIFSLNSVRSFSDVPDKTIMDNFLRETVKRYRIPGLAVAVVNDQGVLYSSGFGESSHGVKVTPVTPFLLGSTTKSFTALAVMRLVEEGKVELDSPVKKYIPEFTLAVPGYEDKITIRHLLNHTSGLSDKGASMGEKSLNDELLFLRHCKPESAPGKKFMYLNANYRLLGLVIERVTGMKFGEFLDSQIFRPLGMTSSFAGPEGVQGLAPGHGEIFGFPFYRKQKFRPGALPSGYVVSCASDVSHYISTELKAANGNTGVLNPETVRMTWQPPENIKGGYAMGWMVFDTIGKTPFLGHGGSLENYQSFFYVNPELNLGFVFLINQGGIIPMIGGFGTIRNGLIRIMDGENPEKGPGSKPVLIVLSVFGLITAFELYLIYRLKRWKTDVDKRKKWKVWSGIILDLVISVALAILIIDGWSMIYNMLPEFFLLLLIMIAAGLLRSFYKIPVVLNR